MLQTINDLNNFDPNNINFWIYVIGFMLIILEIVILRPYSKPTKISPKKLYGITIIITLALIALFSIGSSIEMYILQSQTDSCITHYVSEMASNKTVDPDDILKCSDDKDGKKFQTVSTGAIITVIALFIQFSIMIKNKNS